MKIFKDFYNSDKAANRYASKDGSEAWFDYRVGGVNYHMSATAASSGEKYLIGAWFDGLNYDSLGRHVCRFQAESKNFAKALNKIRKLRETKGVEFDGGCECHLNTSGSRWKIIRFN